MTPQDLESIRSAFETAGRYRGDSDQFYDRLQALTWQINIDASAFPSKFHPDNFRKANDLMNERAELNQMAKFAAPMLIRRAVILRILHVEIRQMFAPETPAFTVYHWLDRDIRGFRLAAAKAILPAGLMPECLISFPEPELWHQSDSNHDTASAAIAVYNTLLGYAEHHQLPIEEFPCRAPITAFPPNTTDGGTVIVTPEEAARLASLTK
jgi:hypothetical protein